MLSKLLIIHLTISLLQIVYSQEGWYQLTSGTNQRLSGLYFTSADTGYVSGQGGIILKTTNGGLNWVIQTSGTVNELGSIYFVTNNTGYIVGGSSFESTILKTTNGGVNWFQQSSGTNRYLLSVYFTDLNTGYAVGAYNTIAKTTNGGMLWLVQSGTSRDLTSVYFTDPNTGYVTSTDNGIIYKTINGGFSWNTLVSGTSLRLHQVVFPNATTGYVAGGGFNFPNVWSIILKTTNSGNTWSNQMFSGTELFTICFNNVNTGYVASETGRIRKTTNGGDNWIPQISGTTNALNELFFYDLNTGYCVGGFGVILKTTNGGITGLELLSNEIPKEYKLYQNYPNPFNPSTKIRFDVPPLGQRHAFDVQVVVYDILGREIITLVNEALKAGTYEVDFNGENLSSGIYYYTIKTDNGYTETKKMVLTK